MKMKLLPAFVIALSLIISVEAFFSFNILNEIENSPKGAHAGGLAGFIGGITAGFFVGGPLGAAAGKKYPVSFSNISLGGFVGMCAGAISGNLAGGLTKHAGYSEEWEVVNAIFVGGPIGAFAGWGVANEVVSRNFVALGKIKFIL